MSEKSKKTMNAWVLRQASSCPLKVHFLRDAATSQDSEIPYKSETKIMMRRALGLIYSGGREADNSHKIAIGQTRKWLNARESIVYGGVVAWQNYHARLPVLIRNGQTLTLLQLHGKVWKPNKKSLDEFLLGGRKQKVYVREAAYKKWILSKHYPGMELSIRLCFPNPRFRSEIKNLYNKIAFGEADRQLVESLFVEIKADSAVDRILNHFNDEDLHPFFRDLSFDEQVRWMGQELADPTGEAPFVITEACKLCPFRPSHPQVGAVGCWENHLNGQYLNPDRHVYDLIGQGNKRETEKENYLQEEVPLPMGTGSFDEVRDYSAGKISILQRRMLQLLAARNIKLPRQWLKSKLKHRVHKMHYPLHFIDFEAATSPIPMHEMGSPYQPVFFQYSCHTLHQNGKIVHNQWLDSGAKGHPHQKFVKNLTSIPNIEDGTLVQYSPFEKQALNTLVREFSRSEAGSNHYAAKLQALLQGADGLNGDRFLDMNRLVRDYYYNSSMRNGLGLKQVLRSTLQSSEYLRQRYREKIEFSGIELQLVEKTEGALADPYSLIQRNNETIDEGSAAMNAWLHTKTPFCDEQKRAVIHDSLKRYCMLDSLALVIIFEQWLHLVRNHSDEGDIVIWD